MASSPPDHNSLDLELTVISAKHLKNVNWRRGPLKPYVSFYLDPNPNPNPNPNPSPNPNLIHCLSTRVDDSGSSRPVWNEVFLLPISRTFLRDSSFLTFEIFHSKPSETPKPLVGTARFSLQSLDLDSPEFTHLDLLRPSGRPQGKLLVKLVLRERAYSPPLYYAFAPGEPFNYHPAPPSPAPSSYGYSGYGYGYYAPPPPPPPPARHFLNLPPNYPPPLQQRGPSAPVDFSSSEKNTEAKPPVPPTSPPPSPPPNVSSYNSMYGPSAPVDYTYPSYDHKPVPPPPRWINSTPPVDPDLSCVYRQPMTVIPPPERWISSHNTSAPVGHAPSYDHRTSTGPTAPDDLASKEEETSVRNGGGVHETVGSVTIGIGGMALEEGSYPRREREGYRGYDDYRHGY